MRPFWAITKYEDIQRISRDPRTFSSVVDLFIVQRSDYEETDAPASADDPEQDDTSQMQLMIKMDPPEHGQYRGIVNRRFSHRGMRLLEDRIDEIAADVIDRVAADIVDEIAPRAGPMKSSEPPILSTRTAAARRRPPERRTSV